MAQGSGNDTSILGESMAIHHRGFLSAGLAWSWSLVLVGCSVVRQLVFFNGLFGLKSNTEPVNNSCENNDLKRSQLFVTPKEAIWTFYLFRLFSLLLCAMNADLQLDFRVVPQPIKGVLGETVVLECQPPRGHPEPQVRWRKNGQPLELDLDLGVDSDR